MEFEGEVISLSVPQDQIKHLRCVANRKDNDIRALKSELQETQRLLTAARERISRLIGEKSMAPRIAKAAKAAKEKARHISRIVAARKKPGDPKRAFSPEKLKVLQENMANARRVRAEKLLERQTLNQD